jgi:hypothetical protein
MENIGIDLHKKESQLITGAGEVIELRIRSARIARS